MKAKERKHCVSVIISAYNAAETLPAMLIALERQTSSREHFEVIIADDGSTDTTKHIVDEAIDRKKMTLKYIYQKNQGVGIARNLGISLATGDVLAFTDADCTCDPDWISVIRQQIRQEKKQLIGGYTYSHDTIIFPWKMAPVHHMGVTANLAVDRHILSVEHEVFNTDFKGMLGHDIDFVVSLENTGVILSYVPEMRVQHPANILSFERFLIRAKSRANEVALFKLHREKVLGSFSPFLKPRFFGRISLFACAVVVLFFAFLLVRWLAGIQVLLMAIAGGGITFLLYFYRFLVIYRPQVDTPISVEERIKTLWYFLLFIPLFFYHRIRGSILFNFFML